MRHQNSVFDAVLKQVPMNALEQLVARHGADDQERGFDAESHFVALLYAARFSAEAYGAKVHVVYDPDADRPVYAAVTAAKVNDITAAQAMPIEAGATLRVC